MSAIGAAEGLSEAILSRKTPDEAATSYSMTGSTITLGKYRLLQPTMPLVFRTNNQSSSFVAVRNITALIGEANSAIHSIGAMNLLTRSRLYADAGDSEKVQSTVSRLRLFTDSGPLQTGNSGPLQTGSGNAPIEAVSERLEQFPVVEHPGTTEPPWKYAMQVHSFNVTEPGSSLHISLSELSRDVPVRLYLRRAKLPSREEFDRNITISTQGCPIIDYIRFNEVCYKSFTEEKTRTDASQACAADGGILAMPKDSATNAYLAGLQPVVRGRWLGLTDVNRDGRWVFEDGQTLTSSGFSNWHNRGDAGGCAAFWGTGSSWDPRRCSHRRGFICQLYGGIHFDVADMLGTHACKLM
uniref:C-type lectin domain-containing protein n=1 Tax=Branchiostoma floridae TaxID=7739 RepID=C3ZZ98_BRAFL|eukprot:XP_002586147.1 hypothetical protein BRAFLDRAFT_105925 [Branchiostoma floridae]